MARAQLQTQAWCPHRDEMIAWRRTSVSCALSGCSWGSAHFTEGKGDTIWITTAVLKLHLSSRPGTTRPPQCSLRRTCCARRGGRNGYPLGRFPTSPCLTPPPPPPHPHPPPTH